MMLALLTIGETLGRPVDASLDGARSDSLFWFATIALLAIVAGMLTIIFWATFAHRGPARYESGVGKSHIVLTVLVSFILFTVVDGTLLVRAARDLREGFWHMPDAPAVTVEVLARQWSFAFRYPGPDGQFGTADDPVVTDELHLPRGRAAILRMRSVDVIHNLYLPNFRVKQDIVPGRTTQLLVTPTRSGDYEFGCSQHCGVNHYKMHGALFVDEPDAFDRWQTDAAREARARDDARNPDAHWGWTWSE